jgi:hypothetical protein
MSPKSPCLLNRNQIRHLSHHAQRRLIPTGISTYRAKRLAFLLPETARWTNIYLRRYLSKRARQIR